MAKIVLSVATSHSPQLSTPVEKFKAHAERDRNNKNLHFRGKVYDYDGLLAARQEENIGEKVTEEIWQTGYDKWENHLATVRKKLADAKPDILVVVGDDQRELFLDDGMPAFAVFWGDEVTVIPHEKLPPSLEPARWANFGERVESYPAHPELGRHIVVEMMKEGFDVAQLTRQFEGRGIGHSFIFTRSRIMDESMMIPMVPITVNTYFPPNQPTSERCYNFGKALRKAIESWDSDLRVALVASGGLSHFVVDEELDQLCLKLMQEKDVEGIRNIPEYEMQSGTSETKNWFVIAGASEDKKMTILDYIPSYRSPAGTGCGMAFAWWE